MKHMIQVGLCLMLIVALMLPVGATGQFVPTPEEMQAAQNMPQSGIISYDAVTDTDMSANLLMTAAWIVAAIAAIILLFTLIVILNKNKRKK